MSSPSNSNLTIEPPYTASVAPRNRIFVSQIFVQDHRMQIRMLSLDTRMEGQTVHTMRNVVPRGMLGHRPRPIRPCRSCNIKLEPPPFASDPSPMPISPPHSTTTTRPTPTFNTSPETRTLPTPPTFKDELGDQMQDRPLCWTMRDGTFGRALGTDSEWGISRDPQPPTSAFF
ncbi:unnamed protein product [Cyclocybe aegerita]|uniref:Uncharacterized protein n=1 Tax=Cyclocybe aegerita TaxID=1973307 RepID=A0A8S0W165_CYCAE|nr:unnamed protein product [Cyclocybe aegerita]